MPFSLSILIERFTYLLRVGEQCWCLIPIVYLSIKMKDGEKAGGGGVGKNSKNMQ